MVSENTCIIEKLFHEKTNIGKTLTGLVKRLLAKLFGMWIAAKNSTGILSHFIQLSSQVYVRISVMLFIINCLFMSSTNVCFSMSSMHSFFVKKSQ